LKKILLNATSLKANIAANFAGNAWVALINVFFVPIYLRYIGAEGYGLIGIFASLQIVLSLLDSGLSTTLNKEIARLSVLPDVAQQMRNLVRTLGNVYWGMAMIAGLIAFGLSPLLARYWVHPDQLSIQTVTYAFILLSISMIFQFPSGFYSGGLLGLQRQVILNGIRIIFATLKSLGALIVLMFFSTSVLAFLGWMLLVSVLQAFTLKFFVWYYLPKAPLKPEFDRQVLKGIWRFAIGMVGISLTGILLTQIDKIILSKILSLEQFGYYTVSCTLGLMIYQIIYPLTQSYFPKFSNVISLNNIDDLKKLYHQGCQMVSLLVLPATFILLFFSKELIFIWTGNEKTVANTWLITSIYALGTGLNGLLNIPYQLTLAYGWTKLAFYQNIGFLCLMIPLIIYSSLYYGALGGALSWAVINALYFFITPHLIHAKLLKGEVAYWYWNDTIIPLLVSLSVLLFFKFYLYNPQSTDSRWGSLLYLVSIGMVTVVTTLLFVKDLRINTMKYFVSK
jgi:O-antigen/teichoic acid export membrane protein